MEVKTLKDAIKLYDDLFRRGQEIIEKYSPCKIEIGKDGLASCAAVRGEIGHSESFYRNIKDGSLCCGGCRYLTSKGCRAHCLACKLHLCNCFSDDHPVKEKLYELRLIAWRHIDFMYSIRKSRKFNIEQARQVLKTRREYGRSYI